ncbi:MAG: glycosyltransferase family 87 protein [Isosphaeraceae bacterium]
MNGNGLAARPASCVVETSPARASRLMVAVCLIAGAVAWARLGGEYAGQMRPKPDASPDFYQDWASARNSLNGLPVYSPHEMTMPLYLGRPQADWERDIAYNAHPPTSVLLALPFTRLGLPDAVLAWNLVMLTAIVGALAVAARQLPELRALFLPVAVLLPFCLPIYGNFQQGQLTFLLVLLITSAWALDRSGRSGLAGALIGAAAAVKLFPAYLVVTFATRGRWRGVLATATMFGALTIVTAAVLGTGAYLDYWRIVLPSMEKFRSFAFNLSFFGFWHKLFDPASERGWVRPLWFSPGVARYGTLLSDLAITAVVAFAVRRARTLEDRDTAFAMAITAMLLVSPVTWDYSLPLLLVPLAIAARAAMASKWLPALLIPVMITFGLPQMKVMEMVLAGRPPTVASPAFMLGVPSLNFYAIVVLFGILAVCRSRPVEV